MKTQKGVRRLPIESKESFLRKTLIEFARKQDVNPKLLETQFEIEVFDKEFYIFLGEVECDFTCSIGYNRTENYIVMEQKQKLIKQPNGNSKWEWVNESVNKTRTVTDWQAYSGSKNGKCVVAIKANGESDEECWNLVKYLAGELEEYDEEIELGNEIVAGGKEALARDFRIETKVGLPGDESKDFSSNEKVKVIEIRKYKIPFYRVKLNYNGKEKSFEHNALVDKFSVSLDKDETEELKYTPLDTKKLAEQDNRVKRFSLISKISWIVGIVLAGLLMIVPGVGFLLSMGAIAVPVVLTIKRSKAYNSVKTELDIKEKKKKENILNEKHKKVYEVLKKALENHGLKSATFDEVYSKTKEE